MQAAIRVSIKFEKVRESFLTLGVPKSPEDGLVAERVLAALHHKLKLVVDIVRGLLLQTSPPHKNEESEPGAANGKPGIAIQAECSRISYSHSSERQNRGRSMQGRERERDTRGEMGAGRNELVPSSLWPPWLRPEEE